MRIPFAGAIVLAAAACSESPPATQPEDFDNLVNATNVDPGAAPGALGNDSVKHGEGSITPAEQNNMGNALRSQEHPSSGNAQQ